MKLEALMNFTIDIGDGLDVGEGPYGNRFIGESNGGHFEGGKLKGSIRAAGSADWLTMTEDFAHLDVRATFVTHDDALIYVEYFGRLELTPATQAALEGEGDTEFGEAYFFTTPRMQTGDQRYRWVNNIVCVARGRLLARCVEYEVLQVVNS
ncbi:MAG: DUF3237 domain-containing protein [Gammaproteobacteria bacterium]